MPSSYCNYWLHSRGGVVIPKRNSGANFPTPAAAKVQCANIYYFAFSDVLKQIPAVVASSNDTYLDVVPMEDPNSSKASPFNRGGNQGSVVGRNTSSVPNDPVAGQTCVFFVFIIYCSHLAICAIAPMTYFA